ncbi:MAG: ParM/StbA family protein [Oscillospiraceae bacterium]|nr:ParM/StbA family protein [Oscillospiraceae bacterium]
MLIAIDHGNKQIKTVHKTFTSGLVESDNRPPFGDSILHCKGKYYTLSDQRIPYMRDKTADERFFVLTLFAIAYEIEAVGAYSDDEIIDIQLAVGLPPAHYGTQHKKFVRYFLDRDVIEFTLNGKAYAVYINEAVCFPQAYAAISPIYKQLQIGKQPKLTLLDIGGFTADYLQLSYGSADWSSCDSLENGVITLYNRVRSKVNADFDLLLDESDIDAILLGKETEYNSKIAAIVEKSAQAFVIDLFSKLRERMIDLRTGKVILTGGGAILLHRQIEASGKVGSAIFVDEIIANAKGYEIMYAASKVGGR